MTKTEKNINSYVNNTIDGFHRTLNTARKNGWDYKDLSRMLDDTVWSVHGALMFVHIYEEKISEKKLDDLTHKLFEAKSAVLNEFLNI